MYISNLSLLLDRFLGSTERYLRNDKSERVNESVITHAMKSKNVLIFSQAIPNSLHVFCCESIVANVNMQQRKILAERVSPLPCRFATFESCYQMFPIYTNVVIVCISQCNFVWLASSKWIERHIDNLDRFWVSDCAWKTDWTGSSNLVPMEKQSL